MITLCRYYRLLCYGAQSRSGFIIIVYAKYALPLQIDVTGTRRFGAVAEIIIIITSFKRSSRVDNSIIIHFNV